MKIRFIVVTYCSEANTQEPDSCVKCEIVLSEEEIRTATVARTERRPCTCAESENPE